MKKMLDDDESSVEVSVHQQPLVTKSCYHQDRDLNKRQNTAAKLRPKVEARILQLTTEVTHPSSLSQQNTPDQFQAKPAGVIRQMWWGDYLV